MGREVKRVALDFQWPLNKPWEGYCNPFRPQKCPACENGYSPEAKRLTDKWYGKVPFSPEERGSIPFLPTHPVVRALAERQISGAPDFYGSGERAIHRESERLAGLFNRSWSHHLNADDVAALLATNRLMPLTHTWTKQGGWVPADPPHTPSPEEVNEWSLSGFGHDSINQWVCVKAECKKFGVSYVCSICEGSGESWASVELEQQHDAWERTEPPAGDGYQIWETVSEGSPISPVFATPEELAQHMAGTRWGGDPGTPYETWLQFINGPGWSPSMVMDGSGVHDGVSAIVSITS